MTVVGIRDGVSLHFDQGTLSSISFDRFDRTIAIQEEISSAPGPFSAAMPYLPLDASLDMSDARYRGLDPYTGRQAQQSLDGGQRSVFVLQGQSTLASGLPEALLARAHMDVTVSAATVYRLRTGSDAVWESEESGAEAYLAPGCTVRVSATVSLAIEDNGHCLRIDLPVGSSTIELWVEGQPPLPFAPAVIVCTPRQMREAAVVASAIGSNDHAYIPLLDLDLPTAGSADVQKANARLSELSQQAAQIEEQMQQVAQQGAQAAGGLVLPGAQSTEASLDKLEQQRASLMAEIEPVQRELLTYAAWSRRSTVVSRLLAALTAGTHTSPRLFVLAPYAADLLAEWGLTAEMTVLLPESGAAQMTTWQEAVQTMLPPEQVEIVYWKDVTDLATQAWTRARGPQEPAFFTIPDEPAFYPVGLRDALRRGRALLPRGRAGQSINLNEIVDKLNADVTSDHAVIVESDAGVAALVGALYAHHVGARLYVNPTPQIDQVFGRMQVITQAFEKEQLSALAASAYRYIGEHRKEFMQSKTADPQIKQVAAGLSVLELSAAIPTQYSDQAFVQSLSTYLTAQQAGAQQGYRYENAQWDKDLAALEGQATVSVAEHVRKGVAGSKRVTAFTGGLPYSLSDGFAGKAVGLVLRDLAAPYVLRVVAHGGVKRPALTMALAVDPGLSQRPAPEVAQIVDRTLTLRGPAASLSNLSALGSVLPLDAVLLNTQGGLDSIFLGDARSRLREVHVAEIGMQANLPSAPLVIYSAPLAWLGVGALLLQQGASGLLGALWPIDEGSTDDAARQVLSAAMVKGQNPAEALLSLPAYDPRATRGFIYLGVAAGWPAAAAGADAVAAAPALYGAAARLLASGRTEAAGLVYDRLRVVTGEIAAGDPALRAEMLIVDADFQTRQTSRQRERPTQDAADQVWQTLDTVDKMSLPDERKKAAQVALWERVAVLDMVSENYQRATELLAAARDAHRQSGQTAAALSASYMLAMAYERQRQWASARQTLLEVQTGLGGVGNAVGLVSVATSLAYVSLPLAMFPDVTGHLKMAMQASLALGVQVVSETLLQILQVGRSMAQMGAWADLGAMARTLAGVLSSDARLPEADRTAIAGVLGMMQQTADVLSAGLPAEEREVKLAALVERAQADTLAHSLGMDAWILGAGSPAGASAGEEQESQEDEAGA